MTQGHGIVSLDAVIWVLDRLSFLDSALTFASSRPAILDNRRRLEQVADGTLGGPVARGPIRIMVPTPCEADDPKII